jgi:hypothetical protein
MPKRPFGPRRIEKGLRMGLDQLASVLVAVTQIEMVFANGIGGQPTNVIHAARNRRLMTRAIPCAAIALLPAVNAHPPVAAGVLIPAMDRGTPYAPPPTALSLGSTANSVGLMMILADSLMLIAPRLPPLLPLAAGGADLPIGPSAMIGTIVVTQLLSRCCGLTINHRRPGLPQRGDPDTQSHTHVRQLLDVRLSEIIGKLILLGTSPEAGWIAGGRWSGNGKAMTLATSIRSLGFGLQITTSAPWWRRSRSLAEIRSISGEDATLILDAVLQRNVERSMRWVSKTPKRKNEPRPISALLRL